MLNISSYQSNNAYDKNKIIKNYNNLFLQLFYLNRIDILILLNYIKSISHCFCHYLCLQCYLVVKFKYFSKIFSCLFAFGFFFFFLINQYARNSI
jgi:hypothetical protein